jgi:transposase
MPASRSFRPLRYARHAWAPMTDAEWDLLRPLVTRPGPGRPPAEPRRTWDAIFWVACSAGPWKHLPEALGRPDTAHRALRRALRSGVMDALLLGISRHRVGRQLLAPLGWRIARAWRRLCRLVPLPRILVARKLGLLDALPCDPWFLPKPHLSELLRAYFKVFLAAGPIRRVFLGLLKVMHGIWGGDRRQWRLTD